jgi:multicomponent Na+:H+ antiporter subunit B
MVELVFAVDAVLLFLLVLTALSVVFVKDLMASTILLTIFSLLMACVYLVLGAVDVAITEAAVGGGISTILFLLAISLVGNKEKKTKGNFILPFMIVSVVTFGLLYATFDMPSVGNMYAPSQIHIAPYYIENGPIETGIPNVVTSILASYRGFDTFGETVVILTAAIAVMLLLGRFDNNKDGK